MNIERLLADTFAEHEDLAPHPDAVWTDVQRELRGGRSFTRPLAVAASVLVVAGVATGIAVSADSGVDRRGVPAASRMASLSTSPVAPRITPLAMPFDLGWLPSGDIVHRSRRASAGSPSGGEYLMTIKTPGGSLDVDVQQTPGGIDGVHFKCGGKVSVTIAGRPGVESADAGGRCGYEVYFRDAAGGTTYVNVAAPESATGPAKLTGLGRRVAANVRFPGRSTVVPSFGVTHLPSGLRMTSFDVGTGGATMYTLGAASGGPVLDVGTNFGGFQGAPGPRVHGHPTRYVDVHGRRMVSVLGAVHGKPVGIAGRVSRAELYEIADGLVLP